MTADVKTVHPSEHAWMEEFRDRRHAGRQLAPRLLALAQEHPVVIALPRGGVPVGFEVARRLEAPLDVLAVRELGAPGNPEFGVGAIAEDGTAVLNPHIAGRLGMTQNALDLTVEREVRELRRGVERYRDGRAPAEVHERTVIVVDDGLATGLTAIAAVRALRARGAKWIVVGVPVGARESIALVAEEADEVVCHTIPDELLGIGRWYHDFSPVADSEVVTLLDTASARAAASDLSPAWDDPALAEQSPAPRRVRVGGPRELRLNIGGASLAGDLTLPARPRGLVIFAHGSGSSRLSPRNRAVAATLNQAGLATLLFDLLTTHEGERGEFVFDIPLLARRLELVTRWALDDPATDALPVGYFGASTGAAAALVAAGSAGDGVRAVVSRGGRADLAADWLPRATAATLLLVGGRDLSVLALNLGAAAMLRCPHRLVVVDGAGHLFEEPGTLETVARLAVDWFNAYLVGSPQPATGG